LCIEESDELLWGEASVHVEGEYAAVMPADRAHQTLQLRGVVIPDGAVTFQEVSDGRDEGDDAI